MACALFAEVTGAARITYRTECGRRGEAGVATTRLTVRTTLPDGDDDVGNLVFPKTPPCS